MKTVCAMRAAILLLPLLGCAGYPAPTDKLSNSLANIRAAQEVGAADQPQAALFLKLAQEEHAKARAMMNDGKNEDADYMTLRATADAELAISLARQASAQSRAAHLTAEANAPPPVTTAPPTFSATTTTTSTTVPANGSATPPK